MLILRNRDSSLGNVHTWVVSPCYVVDLMILRNRFFRLRNFQVWISAVLQGGRSADIHEFSFHTAKRADMDSVEL